MSFFLLDHANPNGAHFYPTARGPKLAVVVHVTAGLQDLDGGDDLSCEQTARYAATTDREVSWHGGSDTNSFLYLLPPRYVAWHVVGYNTHTYGWEISKTHTDWRSMPEWWVDATLRQAAAGLRPVLAELGIPIRKATRAELDRAIATGGAPVGLISHAELQPKDRTDPGLVAQIDTFPWDRFLALLRGVPAASSSPLEDTVITIHVPPAKSGGVQTIPVPHNRACALQIVPAGSPVWVEHIFNWGTQRGTSGDPNPRYGEPGVGALRVDTLKPAVFNIPEGTAKADLVYSSDRPFYVTVVGQEG